jgi:hypothetical protein
MILHIHSDASYLSENEAKIRAGELFYMGSDTKTNKKLTNGAIGAVLRTTLEELGYPHPPTTMETDNTTVTGYSNGTIKQKRTKAMDMRFYWIKDRVKQGLFNVYWGPGYQNLANYLAKHHLPAHHKRMREIYIHADERPINWKGIRDSALRGRVNSSGKAGAQITHLPLGDDSSPRGR